MAGLRNEQFGHNSWPCFTGQTLGGGLKQREPGLTPSKNVDNRNIRPFWDTEMPMIDAFGWFSKEQRLLGARFPGKRLALPR